MEQQESRELELKCTQESLPACAAACPLHVDARELMRTIQKEDFKGAAKILEKRQPFPGIISRICDHPCQNSCVRKDAGGTILIGELERYCVNYYPVSPLHPKAISSKQQRVAVVGGGLSGVAAAWELAKKGYTVVLFEREAKLGGRLLELDEKILPSKVIEDELSVLAKNGVQIRLNTEVGSDLPFLQVKEEFAAVYVACGIKGKVPADILDSNGNCVIDPTTFTTFQPGVFAGGSMRIGESFVKSAADGRRAALSIDRYLQQASLTASRENEGEFDTDLFVSLKNVISVPPVTKSLGEELSKEEALAEAGRCLDCQCLECVKACKFLESFGEYPKKYVRAIYNNESIVMGIHHANKMINSCNLCGQCAVVCPNHLDMGEVIKVTREKMVARGKMPPSAHAFALEDMEFSNSDLFALAKHQPGTESSQYLFFPGCQLSASSPEQVQKVYGYLQNNLSDGVGLMLRCCGAPAGWAGRQDLVAEAEDQMRKQWEDMDKPIIITACSTCYEMFKPKYPKVVSLWEIIYETGLPEKKDLGLKLAIHDACTTRHETEIHRYVREILQQLGCKIEELPYNREETTCCGYGGLMWSANRDLSRETAAARVKESASEYVVYCAMCRDQFAGQGKATVHVLDLLFDNPSMEKASAPGPGFSERHENRARLKRHLLQEVWQEEPAPERSYMAVKLYIADEVKELLEERRILLEDVQKVIENAESTGRKFVNKTNSHILAYFKPASATYWVEYGIKEDGFIIYNAYFHRMEIMEDVKE